MFELCTWWQCLLDSQVSTFSVKIETVSYNKETQRIIFASISVQAVITLWEINERFFCSYQEGFHRFSLERADGWEFEYIRKNLFV